MSDPVSSVGPDDKGDEMLIDCASCEMRDIACDDCVISVLLGTPPAVEIEDETTVALGLLADGGLVPPLRHTAWRRATG